MNSNDKVSVSGEAGEEYPRRLRITSDTDREQVQTFLQESLPIRHPVLFAIDAPISTLQVFSHEGDFYEVSQFQREHKLLIVFDIVNTLQRAWASKHGLSLHPLRSLQTIKLTGEYLDDSPLTQEPYQRHDQPLQTPPEARRESEREYAFSVQGNAKHLKHAGSVTRDMWKKPWLVLSLLFLVAILLGSLQYVRGAFAFPVSRTVSPDVSLEGSVAFQSSDQLSLDGTHGTLDAVQVTLAHLPALAAGQAYYVWLLADAAQSDGLTLLLGRLPLSLPPVSSVTPVTLHYQSPTGDNLLAHYSRLLVTRQSAQETPIVPSLASADQIAGGGIAQTPNPKDTVHHYSLLDHVRHLLASDPSLDTLGLHGGLDVWQYRNTQTLLGWAQSVQEQEELLNDGVSNDPSFLRRQLVRMVDYLDGLQFAAHNLPGGTPFLVDRHLAQVGLLEAIPGQKVPGYFFHIGEHLRGIAVSPGVSQQQAQLAAILTSAVNHDAALLTQVREEASDMLRLSDSQIRQEATMTQINTMVIQVNEAYVGTPDVKTGVLLGGSAWIHTQIVTLASFTVSLYHR